MSNSYFDWLDFCSKHGDIGVANELQRLTAECDSIRALNAELLEALTEARHALQLANDTPSGPINDTIWMMHRPETLFDFLDAAIARARKHEDVHEQQLF